MKRQGTVFSLILVPKRIVDRIRITEMSLRGAKGDEAILQRQDCHARPPQADKLAMTEKRFNGN